MANAEPQLSDIERLLNSVSPKFEQLTTAERNGSADGIRILCLDGGGIRGLVLIEMLLAIEEAIKPKKIHEAFDLICGTSTGGILALAIGAVKKSVSECKELYLNLATTIFGNPRKVPVPSIHDAQVLIEELRKPQNFGNKTLSDCTNGPKVFTVATLAESHLPSVYLYRNYSNIESTYKGTDRGFLWEAARATSAAPVYFQPFTKGADCFIDGGVLANNPTMVAISEARSLWPNKRIETIVSLGTGRFQKQGANLSPIFAKTSEILAEHGSSIAQLATAVSSTASVVLLMKMLIEIATDAEETHHTVTTMNSLLNNSISYHRHNPPIKFVELDEADPQKLHAMLKEVQHYVNNNDVAFASLVNNL